MNVVNKRFMIHYKTYIFRIEYNKQTILIYMTTTLDETYISDIKQNIIFYNEVIKEIDIIAIILFALCHFNKMTEYKININKLGQTYYMEISSKKHYEKDYQKKFLVEFKYLGKNISFNY